MNLAMRLEQLLQAAQAIGVDVRHEPMGGEGGGMCVFGGKRVLFVDTLADPETQYEKTLADLAPLTELDDQFLIPEIREDIEKIRNNQ